MASFHLFTYTQSTTTPEETALTRARKGNTVLCRHLLLLWGRGWRSSNDYCGRLVFLTCLQELCSFHKYFVLSFEVTNNNHWVLKPKWSLETILCLPCTAEASSFKWLNKLVTELGLRKLAFLSASTSKLWKIKGIHRDSLTSLASTYCSTLNLGTTTRAYWQISFILKCIIKY